MSNNDWMDLTDIEAVALAKSKGWEIEFRLSNGEWQRWLGEEWSHRWVMRGRPAQPKKVTVTSQCWRDTRSGDLTWREPESTYPGTCWKRFPAGDIIGEVEA